MRIIEGTAAKHYVVSYRVCTRDKRHNVSWNTPSTKRYTQLNILTVIEKLWFSFNNSIHSSVLVLNYTWAIRFVVENQKVCTKDSVTELCILAPVLSTDYTNTIRHKLEIKLIGITYSEACCLLNCWINIEPLRSKCVLNLN